MKTTILLSAIAMMLALPTLCQAANSIVPVPEPATGLLLLASGAGLAAYRKLRGPRQ
jgi:hypothetical protein